MRVRVWVVYAADYSDYTICALLDQAVAIQALQGWEMLEAVRDAKNEEWAIEQQYDLGDRTWWRIDYRLSDYRDHPMAGWLRDYERGFVTHVTKNQVAGVAKSG